MSNTVLTLESNKYAIKIENFEGPLDLLCHLIDKNKMDIYDIKISQITDQYVSYLNEMEQMNLEIASEFLVMASTLIYLKSKSLLPKQVEEEKEVTEEELIQRIIEYKKYKEITKTFRKNYEQYANRHFRLAEQIPLPKQVLEKEYSSEILPNLYKNILQRIEQRKNQNASNIEKIAITETYTVASKVKEMFQVLFKKQKFVFNRLFSIKEHSKKEVVTAFGGLLEMSRRNKVQTKQEDLFGDIVVQKNKKIG